MSLSTVIITKNEAKNIERCIESVLAFSDEIIIVDDFSTDTTKAIALKYSKVRFYERKFDDYIRQKNYANSLVDSDYILSLDADEYADAEWNDFFISKKYKSYAAISFLRINYFNQTPVRNGIWRRDIKIRCWKKNIAEWSGTIPHESLKFHTQIQVYQLQLIIHHLAYSSYQEFYNKSINYAKMAAHRLASKPYPSLIFGVVVNPTFKFIKGFFLLQGFKDGLYGWYIAKVSFSETLYKYLYALQIKWKK